MAACTTALSVLAACAADGRDLSSPPTGNPSVPGNGVPSPTTAPVKVSSVAPLDASVDPWNEGTIVLSDGAPTQDWGVSAGPTTGGPYPVALLLHGNHPTCPTDTGGGTWPYPTGTEQANHEGLAYLAEALAARGFVVIAPGINVQYTLGASWAGDVFAEPAPPEGVLLGVVQLLSLGVHNPP